MPQDYFVQTFTLNLLSAVCNEAAFDFSELPAPSARIHDCCFWMSLENLGQLLKCDALGSCPLGGQEFVHLNKDIHFFLKKEVKEKSGIVMMILRVHFFPESF